MYIYKIHVHVLSLKHKKMKTKVKISVIQSWDTNVLGIALHQYCDPTMGLHCKGQRTSLNP